MTTAAKVLQEGASRDFCFWPEAAVLECLLSRRYWGRSGQSARPKSAR